LLQPLGYKLGKLTPRGVEFYAHWDPDLETFVEANYVACLPEIAAKLPVVSWWKLATRSDLAVIGTGKGESLPVSV
jgi:hypothetical protein